MPQGARVEPQPFLEIRHRDGDRVDLMQQRFRHARSLRQAPDETARRSTSAANRAHDHDGQTHRIPTVPPSRPWNVTAEPPANGRGTADRTDRGTVDSRI